MYVSVTKKNKKMETERYSTTVIRKYLQVIRKAWQNGSAQEPFVFTQTLDESGATIDGFCTTFVLDKYM